MSKSARFLVGIDVGGTFTDVLAYDLHAHELLSAKVPSFPGAQWVGVLDALDSLGIAPQSIDAFVHGTTIATNALLERKGACTGLVTTLGFRDVLEIGKARRLNGGLFVIEWKRPPPIVPRPLRMEVDERVRADGSVARTPSLDRLGQVAEHFTRSGVKAVAVAFINSHVNDAHEREVAASLAALMPGVPVSASAELVAERGEFERTSTCVLNAYLTPSMTHYLDTLAASLAQRGVQAPVGIMGSNGGTMTLAEASRRVAATFLSGPVGGVVGASRLAGMAGVRDIITFDMGGTSTDVALVHDLQARMSYDNQIDAYPLQMPQLDIHTIGAGGGSIVWIGDDGTLQIGPHSAGAVPGPACYGRGGRDPTISDANLVLGRLPVDRPIASDLRLDRTAAEEAFAPLAAALGAKSVVEVADSALKIAVARMAGAVREVSVHRGFDPRDFTLLGYGGAGPMHVFLVAEELGISQVMIPRFPGHLCAMGQMLADLRRDLVVSCGGLFGVSSLPELREKARTLRERAAARLRDDGVLETQQEFNFSLDMRYAGQSFALQVGWDPAEGCAPPRAAFDERHHETFGYASPESEVEVVNLRLVAMGKVKQPAIDFSVRTAGESLLETRRVWFGHWCDCPVFSRTGLPAGWEAEGPAIIEEAGGTTVVPPGWSVVIDNTGAMRCRALSSDSWESRVSSTTTIA